jgi:hypothetical protein
MKLPRWDCRNQAEQDRFEKWCNEQLNAFYEAQEGPPDLQRENDPAFAAVIAQDFKRVLVRKAVGEKDANALVRLTSNDPQLLRLAFQLLTQKRGRGRPKGSRRRSDLERKGVLDPVLAEAASEMKDLRHIWWRYYGKRNRSRSIKPTAIEIVARRWNIEESALRNYLKNHGRFLRHQ